MTMLTLSAIATFLEVDNANILNSTVGGMTIGVLLAFVAPFWMGRLSKQKSFRKYL